jgi:hypothetical protein
MAYRIRVRGNVCTQLSSQLTHQLILSHPGGLDDQKRVDYFNSYLTAVHQAINRDGCNVKGYIAWSLMDSFEWKAGFTEKFGLYHVDFNDRNRKRTPKLSALVFSNIAKMKQIDRDYRPQLMSSSMHSDRRQVQSGRRRCHWHSQSLAHVSRWVE